LEWKLADEKFWGLLILADFPQGHGAGSVAALLVGSGGQGAAAGGLGGQFSVRSLAPGGSTGCLLGACHV
jgi:hypothetical protein